MVGWIVLGVFVALIVLILVVPIGADIAYEGGQFRVCGMLGGIKLQLYPKAPEDESKPKKEKKPQKEKKPKEPQKEQPEKAKPKFSLFSDLSRDELLALVKTALKGFSRFGKVIVDRFLLHYTAAGADPYNTAMTYNYVNAALSILSPICRDKFIVRSADVWTDIDFTKDKMELDIGVCMAIRLLQVTRVGRIIIFGALGITLKHRLRKLMEQIKNRGKAPEGEDAPVEESAEKLPENKEDNKNEDTTQEDERMNNDGK